MWPPQSAAAGAGRAALPARVTLVAIADAALAGVLVAPVELGVIAARTPPAASELAVTGLVVTGLVIAGVAIVGAPLVLLLRLVGHHPHLRRFTARIASPGPDRVIALVALASVIVILAVLWGLGFAVARFAHATYSSSTGAALMTATFALAAQMVAVLVATAITPTVAAWLGARRWMVRATAGLPVAVTLVALVAAAVVVGDHLLRTRFHSWDPVPAYVVGSAAMATAVAAVIRPRQRLGRRRLGVMSVVAVVVVASGIAVGMAPAARGALMASGVVSEAVLRAGHRLADRDGDGHAGVLGGGDCDDRDRAVHPGAREVAGNRRDDNCIGGDGAVDPALAAAPAATKPTIAGSNVLLVTIDSVGAEQTSAYGYRRPTTPHLARLARRGLRFDRAHTASPTTRRALPALLFGRYPSTLPFDPRSRMSRLVDHEVPTLASVLAGAGYRTHAVLAVGGLLDDASLAGFASSEALVVYSRGYTRPDNAVEVTDRTLTWLARPGSQPWFLWVHYFDPHHPYRTPPGAPRFGDRPIDHHDAEIAHADAQLGRLLAAVDGAGTTLVVVTADHGEAFGAHGVSFHGKNLHDDQSRVPLVFATLGAPAPSHRPDATGAPDPSGRVESQPVSLVDVAPTILELVGAAIPAAMSGRSLAAAVAATGPAPARPIVLELVPDRFVDRRMVAIVDGDHKLIWDLDANAMAAYDLRRDPAERVDLIATPLGAVLRATLGETLDRELATPRP